MTNDTLAGRGTTLIGQWVCTVFYHEESGVPRRRISHHPHLGMLAPRSNLELQSPVDEWRSQVDLWQSRGDVWRSPVDVWRSQVDVWRSPVDVWQNRFFISSDRILDKKGPSQPRIARIQATKFNL